MPRHRRVEHLAQELYDLKFLVLAARSEYARDGAGIACVLDAAPNLSL